MPPLLFALLVSRGVRYSVSVATGEASGAANVCLAVECYNVYGVTHKTIRSA